MLNSPLSFSHTLCVAALATVEADDLEQAAIATGEVSYELYCALWSWSLGAGGTYHPGQRTDQRRLYLHRWFFAGH